MAPPANNPQTAGQKTEVVIGDDAQHLIAERRTQMWSGPLPSPEDFSAYPQAARDFILNAAKEEGSHRRNIEAKAQEANIAHGKRGQKYAFIVAMVSLAVSGALIYSGRNWGAVIAVGIIVAVWSQMENLLKALFGGGKKNGGNRQHNGNGHSDG